MNFLDQACQKPEHHRQTDRQTDRKTDATKRITTAVLSAGKNPNSTCRYTRPMSF